MERATTIHGCAVAVGSLGLLILGESGAGKSSLAARMIADWPFGKVRLVADDRVRLSRYGERLVARAHPAITGQLELRGYGIVSMDILEAAVIHGVIKLSADSPTRLPEPDDLVAVIEGLRLPCITLSPSECPIQRLITIWPYFSGQLMKL
jgi:HPr kinase/phosphorylase